ncbi:MAG: hypothetical protein AB1798_00780 [Spirochaetota bacterium]
MTGATAMDENKLKEEIRREIDYYFHEKFYDSPVFKLAERIVRVEEAIKHLSERIDDLIHQIDKRFEQVDKRFEQVDKRFEDLIHQIDKRFDQVDKHFRMQFSFMSIGFTILAVLMTVYNFVK